MCSDKLENPKSKIQNPNKVFRLLVGIWTLGFWIFFLGCAFAADVNTGVTGGNFLKLGSGVRAASIGGAFIAVADDPYAVYWNPAGLSQLKSMELTSTYSTWFSGTSYTNIAAALPFGKSTIGVMLNNVNIGPMEETTLAKPAGTGQIFNPTESALFLAYSQRIRPGFSLGAGIKSLNQNLTGTAASGWGLDIGALWRWEDYIVGFSGRNILGSMGSNKLTSNYGLGMCYRLNPFLFALDANLPNDNKMLLNFGLGYNYNNLILGRVGFNTRSEENAGGNFSVGLGYNYKNIKIDYAFIPYGDLGQTHKIAISLYPFGMTYPRVVNLEVFPAHVKIAVGRKMIFRAEGITRRDDYVEIVPYFTTDGNIGEIEASTGTFTAKKIGRGTVRAILKLPKEIIRGQYVEQTGVETLYGYTDVEVVPQETPREEPVKPSPDKKKPAPKKR